MSYKLPGLPNKKADAHELADCVEIIALKQGQVSKIEIAELLNFGSDGDIQLREIEEDETESFTDDAWKEIERRIGYCGSNRYPFCINTSGNLVEFKNDRSDYEYLYLYLLIATRLNMQEHKINSGIDGTLLLEKISEKVAANYLGERSSSFLFGTSSNEAWARSFGDRVESLCAALGEGDGFSPKDDYLNNAIKDDGLDVVAWKNFSDNGKAKLIAFGQCKTGTNWKNTLESLNTSGFVKRWFKSPTVVDPIKMFFLAEALPRYSWYSHTTRAGILFDRCRIMDFADSVSADVMGQVKAWTEEAKRIHVDE